MEYTTNYQLPTWVETDRIQMDDFNDMTDKLDAAIAAVNQRIDQVNPVVKLKEVVLASNQSRVDIDLSDVDWDLYREVQVWFGVVTNASDGYKVLINNLDNMYKEPTYYLAWVRGVSGTQRGTIRLMPAGGYVGAFIEVSYNSQGNTTQSYTNTFTDSGTASQINFIMSDSGVRFKTGSEFIVYGIKK